MQKTPYAIIAVGLAIAITALICGRASEAQTRPGGSGGSGSVKLQSASPGTAQTGNFNVTGIGRMGNVYGSTIGNDTANVALRSPGLASGGAPFNFDTTAPLTSGQIFMTFSAQGGFMNLYASPVTGGSPIITPQSTSLTVCSTAASLGTIYPGACYAGDTQVNLVGKNIIQLDTGSTVIANGTTFFRVRNNGVNKFSLTGDGIPTFAAPVPLSSGGTGSASVTACAAGQFWTSNGTTVSCANVPAGTILGSGRITSTGTITVQNGLAITVTKGGTGAYTVNLASMTANGVVVVTPMTPGAGAGRHATFLANAGNFTVQMKSGADGLIDEAFSYAILSL